jgi:hypothetical protein
MMLIDDGQAADESPVGTLPPAVETVFFSLTHFQGYSLSDTNV